MKALLATLPSVELRRALVIVTAVTATVLWLATWPRFQHPIRPLEPSPFAAWIYLAIAGLAAFSVPAPVGLRVAIWAPTVSHLVLMLFAIVSFANHGHWPWYSHPDPKDLAMPFLHGASFLAVLSGALAIPFGAIMLGTVCFETPRRPRVMFLHAAAVLALGTWLWLFEWKSGRLIDWLVD